MKPELLLRFFLSTLRDGAGASPPEAGKPAPEKAGQNAYHRGEDAPVTLTLPNAGIRREKLLAMQAFALANRMHGSGQPRRRKPSRQTSARRHRRSPRAKKIQPNRRTFFFWNQEEGVHRRNRDFQAGRRRWVSDRCWPGRAVAPAVENYREAAFSDPPSAFAAIEVLT